MFNSKNSTGSNVGDPSDKTICDKNSNLSRFPISNNTYQNYVNNSAMMHGATGQHQHNSTSLAAHTQALANQQQRLFQMKKNDFEVQQMASNIKESLLIKQRLESIQHLQQQEANKIRAEMHMTATSGIGNRNSTSISSSSRGLVPSATKSIPSTSNSSVLPNKRREDEMTKPDLSTLAETAVAVASASKAADAHRRHSDGMMGIDRIIKMNNANSVGSNHIAALLGRQSSISSDKGLRAAGSSTSLPLSTGITSTISNHTMTDVLRRDINATRDKLHLDQSYKRSLDEMTKSNTTTAPSSSSWLWKSAALGNNATMSMAEHLQRRNSLPAPASALSSEFSSLRSLKRQRLLEQKTNEIGGLGLHDAMNQMRQLDAKLNVQANRKTSLLAEVASKISSQERRASIASSIASVGTSATAPNFITNSCLSSPANHRNIITVDSTFDDRSKVLNKLSKMGGGFPMPKFQKLSSNSTEGSNTASGSTKSNVPVEITPELGKDVVDITGREKLSLSLEQQLDNNQQSRYLERIGGFPMPPLYRHNDEIVSNNQYGTTADSDESGTRSDNTVSSHIRNNVNRTGTKASRPPTLESYKRLWRDIRVVAGDDPAVDERLRKEVFARKLQRGEILVGKSGNSRMTKGNVKSYLHQRRLSDLSRGSFSGNNSNNNSGTENDDSIIV